MTRPDPRVERAQLHLLREARRFAQRKRTAEQLAAAAVQFALAEERAQAPRAAR